ncbi:PIG-L family deacetylase [Goodfellowiella coeruleoviolacea]|nr:PIG-L family deacetylase [Goodfellowiella coeruleoviolacea]
MATLMLVTAPLVTLAGMPTVPVARSAETKNAVVNFSAHPDDDLLFMNPDIVADIQGGKEVWTVYLTAGDVPFPAGPLNYANHRVEGELAAYARAAGVPNVWEYDPLFLSGREVSSYVLADAAVRLVFTYIHAAGPDDWTGDLERLWQDYSFVSYPIDGGDPYTHESLVEMIAELLHEAQPQLIRTQDPDAETEDHIDHAGGALFVAEADSPDGITAIRRVEYYSYPIQEMEPNVTGYLKDEKTAVWYEYRPYDDQLVEGDWDNVMDRQYTIRTFEPGTPWFPGKKLPTGRAANPDHPPAEHHRQGGPGGQG